MNPFFSIIIPTYNRADRVVKAITSVLSQTFVDFEVLVVDDGSSDNTEAVVGRIKDPRIRYFKKENEERSIARNFGMVHSNGKYVNFLDSDDLFFSHHLQTAYDLIANHGFPELAHTGYELKEASGKILLTRDDFSNMGDRMMDDNILTVNSIFIREDIAKAHRFPPYRDAIISEDWCFFLQLLSRYPIVFTPIVTVTIVEHEQRSLKNIDPDLLISCTAIIIKELESDSAFMNRYKSKAGYFFARQYTFVALILSLTKQRRADVLRYLAISMQYDWRVMGSRRFLASLKHLI